MAAIKRIHHISAIVGNVQECVVFYRDILGLRLVKQTVNFEDPNTYHIYFANQTVSLGSLITFFPWENAHKGRVGSGQVGRIAFRIPKNSLSMWAQRLSQHDVSWTYSKFAGQSAIDFTDTHGLALALVEDDELSHTDQILGFHGAVLLSQSPEQTVQTLEKDLGIHFVRETESDYVLHTVGEEAHWIVVPKTVLPPGRWGIGTVHHIAWSVPSEQAQLQYQDDLYDKGDGVTQVKDRLYFKAVYFIERGQVMFEIATDMPGMTVDEPIETVGSALKLPPQYEIYRDMIEQKLQKIK